MHDENDLLHEHIKKISDNYDMIITPAHKKYLISLKQSGFEPDVIYDIGSGALTWTRFAETLWPFAKYIVFDAFQHAEFLYNKLEYDYCIAVLSDCDGKVVRFYQNDFTFFQNSYYREVGCDCLHNYHLDDYTEIKCSTLDSMVKKYDFPLPDLVNINVQGAEKDVIVGGILSINHAERMIVNMHHEECKLLAPRIYQTLPCILSYGWQCDAPLFSDHGPDGDYGFYKKI